MVKSKCKKTILIVIFTLLPHCYSVYGNNIEADLKKAYAKAVAGDIRPILSVFDSVENIDQSEIAEHYVKYKKRFIAVDEQVKFDDPFISRLYSLYTTYWRSSLVDPKSEKKSRKSLVSGLNKFSKEEGRKAGLLEGIMGPSINKLESFLIKIAKKKGYRLLMGKTLPLCELMIWKKEKIGTYNVELPSESFSVDVVFAQDFLLKGWLGYATFDKSHSGGWPRNGKIYRVGAKPNDNDEWFRVSLLGHEGRHMSDKKFYGKLDSWILEYRAKLTELVLADESFWKLLNRFKDESQDNRAVPHAYGSFKLVNDLIDELTEGKRINDFSDFRFEDYSKEKLKGAIELILNKSTKSLAAKS